MKHILLVFSFFLSFNLFAQVEKKIVKIPCSIVNLTEYKVTVVIEDKIITLDPKSTFRTPLESKLIGVIIRLQDKKGKVKVEGYNWNVSKETSRLDIKYEIPEQNVKILKFLGLI